MHWLTICIIAGALQRSLSLHSMKNSLATEVKSSNIIIQAAESIKTNRQSDYFPSSNSISNQRSRTYGGKKQPPTIALVQSHSSGHLLKKSSKVIDNIHFNTKSHISPTYSVIPDGENFQATSPSKATSTIVNVYEIETTDSKTPSVTVASSSTRGQESIFAKTLLSVDSLLNPDQTKIHLSKTNSFEKIETNAAKQYSLKNIATQRTISLEINHQSSTAALNDLTKRSKYYSQDRHTSKNKDDKSQELEATPSVSKRRLLPTRSSNVQATPVLSTKLFSGFAKVQPNKSRETRQTDDVTVPTEKLAKVIKVTSHLEYPSVSSPFKSDNPRKSKHFENKKAPISKVFSKSSLNEPAIESSRVVQNNLNDIASSSKKVNKNTLSETYSVVNSHLQSSGSKIHASIINFVDKELASNAVKQSSTIQNSISCSNIHQLNSKKVGDLFKENKSTFQHSASHTLRKIESKSEGLQQTTSESKQKLLPTRSSKVQTTPVISTKLVTEFVKIQGTESIKYSQGYDATIPTKRLNRINNVTSFYAYQPVSSAVKNENLRKSQHFKDRKTAFLKFLSKSSLVKSAFESSRAVQEEKSVTHHTVKSVATYNKTTTTPSFSEKTKVYPNTTGKAVTTGKTTAKGLNRICICKEKREAKYNQFNFDLPEYYSTENKHILLATYLTSFLYHTYPDYDINIIAKKMLLKNTGKDYITMVTHESKGELRTEVYPGLQRTVDDYPSVYKYSKAIRYCSKNATFCEYHEGDEDSNIILVVPHGGMLAPDGIQPRRSGCYTSSGCSYTDLCEWPKVKILGQKRNKICPIESSTNFYTKEFAITLAGSLQNRTGSKPHIVIMNLQRAFIDVGILPKDKRAYYDRELKSVWDDFHKFIGFAKDRIKNRGVVFNLHSHKNYPHKIILGYSIKYDGDRTRSSLNALLENKNIKLEDATTGKYSLVDCLNKRNITSNILDEQTKDRYREKRGGKEAGEEEDIKREEKETEDHQLFLTKLYGSYYGGSVDAMRISAPQKYCKVEDYVKKVSYGITDFMKLNYQ
ncbi:uncharacterized protein LOC130624046 [Hydractinia symbiolongicarpus]|uniref:uncharacterized protein LOC130624046 n=1 Tax=Hydractinia symbiolongicarpus TaxID=13093 RepID=UPI00254EF6A8|nr:uncharacterized protein LOC130624046 [Hydractinia symbiolongicarpus]XP_057295597.1 uncharacterized protein LOC130624046 [Hydractinia symbiolongicarpus]